MIFVTVGSQLPFDRLVQAVDRWAAQWRRRDVIAQVGRSEYQATWLTCLPHLEPEDYSRYAALAEFIVSHAGTGSVLTALRYGKPILIMPRRVALRETRSDHQVHFCRTLADRVGVYIAMDEFELLTRLNFSPSFRPPEPISPTVGSQLIAAIREFLQAAKKGGSIA